MLPNEFLGSGGIQIKVVRLSVLPDAFYPGDAKLFPFFGGNNSVGSIRFPGYMLKIAGKQKTTP